VRSLDVSCWQCHHRTIQSADLWPDHAPVPSFRARMVRIRCGIIGAHVQPNRREQPARETPAHYASQRRTMRAKIGAANGDATGSQ
jgi:hypothetical protein